MTYLKQVGRTLGLTSLTLGAAAGLVSMGALATFRRSLPRTDGTLRLPRLADRVEVLRDRWGVPHIYATTDQDLFAALGYVHAQDRLWQMELNRCTGQGQLAEIFGDVALSSDRFMRVIGLGRVASRDTERLDDETRTIVEAYTHGINTFLEANSHRLPLEFTLLRHQPRPWTATDVVVGSKVIAYMLSVNWTVELMNAHLVALVGAQRAQELMMQYPANQPITLPHNIFSRHGIGEEFLRTAAEIAPSTNGHKYGEGSNAWVVSGRRSASGKPLLANDPHLNISMPIVWYETHLEGGNYHVSGVTMPGLPGMVIGHNARIAWGITNSLIDVQDLFIERFHPDDSLRYDWCGHWEQAEQVQEVITVKGQPEPVVETVRITRHGPVIASVAAPPDSPLNMHHQDDTQQPEDEDPDDDDTSRAQLYSLNEALALRWTGFDSSQVIPAALALNRAQNWQEFRAALAIWDSPSQNFVYADVDGHYGYALAGLHPIRAQGDGRVPVPGWEGTYEWTGVIPADELPAVYDPPDGFIVTANNRLTDHTHPHHHNLHGEWMNGYRALRIRELIEYTPHHDTKSFSRMQTDIHSLPGLELARLIADLPLDDSVEIQARDILAAWDGEMDTRSVGAAIYATLRYHLERQTYVEMDELRYARSGIGLFQLIPGSEILNRRSLPGILARIAAAKGEERSDPWLGSGRTWNDVLRESMQLTVAELRQRFGADPQTWRYERMHTLKLRHPLGRSAMLAPIFNRGTWPIGGDIDTICLGYIPHDTPANPVCFVPQYRQICDTSDWDASVSIIVGGQSGHPASRHYCDMTQLWLHGKYHPMLWSRARVEQHTVSKLLLEPDVPKETKATDTSGA